MRFRKGTIILFLFTLYGVNYFLFERILFFNELLSVFGLYYFTKHCYKGNLKFRIPQNSIFKAVLCFILLGGFYALVSIPFKTNWYYYFRNLSIIYSAFGFFLGYYLYHDQFVFFKKIKNWVYGYAFISMGLRWDYLIDRNAYAFWFSFLQKNWRLLAVIGLVIIHFLYIAAFTSLTVVIILLVVLGLRFFIRTYTQFKLLFIVSASAFCIVFALAIPYLKMYNDGYSLFGDVQFVYSQHPLFKLDDNTSWRLIFWYRTVVEAFPQSLFGIGIGTPILPYLPEITTSDLNFPDEYVAHVIGTHNTFVTIYVRFGIVSLLLLGLIYRSAFREFFVFKKYYLENKNDINIFLGFFVLSTVGLFNLLVDTPTLAILYWVSLGFVSKAINNRQIKKYSTRLHY